MANIFNDSTIQNTNQNGTFTHLVAQDAIIENAAIDNLTVDNSFTTNGITIPTLNNGDLLKVGAAGVVNGLSPGTENDVLKTSGGQPTWTNSITLNEITTNTLSIPGTQNGDLFTVISNEFVRIPIGLSGTFLLSDGSTPSWQPLPNPLNVGALVINNTLTYVGLNEGSLLVGGTSGLVDQINISPSGYFLQSDGTTAVWAPIPDPFIVGSIQVNNNMQLNSFPNRTLITDGSGFVTSEQPQYSINGASALNTTPTQIYGFSTWSMTQYAYYRIKISITTTTTTAYYGRVEIALSNVQNYSSPAGATNTVNIDFIYQYIGPTSNIVNFQIIGQTLSGTASISGYTIWVERIPIPTIHL